MLSRLLGEVQTEVLPVRWRGHSEKTHCVVPSPQADDVESGIAAVERQLREAYESGVRDGEALGRRALERKVDEVVARMAAALADVAAARVQVIRRARADVVRLSLDIARRVLHRELTVDPAALEALVMAALEKIGTQEIYRARVHPKQEPLVRRCLQELHPAGAIEVVADSSQGEGGIIFESAQGALDASVETQLLEIERGLADRLGDSQ